VLYEGLVRFAPNIGASLGRAVALAQAGNPSAGLNALDALPQSSVLKYQPFWAARGHLLRLLNRNQEAHKAFTRAASLTDDPALREYLFKRSMEKPAARKKGVMTKLAARGFHSPGSCERGAKEVPPG
jgi:RNA polymerase sigma-70 factor (ECF subfamily)